MSRHPVGATWQGVEEETGIIATIWLSRRDTLIGYEVWKWECTYSDNSRPVHWSDWGTSYGMCKRDLPINCRMKRATDREVRLR